MSTAATLQSAAVSVGITSVLKGLLGGVAASPNIALKPADIEFVIGTGAGKVSKVYFKPSFAIAGGATQTIDFNAPGNDYFGNAVVFGKVRALLLVNEAAAAADAKLVVGPDGTNGFVGPLGGTDPTVDVDVGGGVLLWRSLVGWTIDGTHKVLDILNAGAAAGLYSLIVLGE